MTERNEYQQGQRDAIATLLASPLIDESVKTEIRHAAYEERAIPKAIVDEAIEQCESDE
jgi:hypothetical protein